MYEREDGRQGKEREREGETKGERKLRKMKKFYFSRVNVGQHCNGGVHQRKILARLACR